MQDNFDVWNNSMDLAGITNKGIVGFKYFGFGGLAQDTKGIKAFNGIQKGDGATLNLHLTPGGHGAFKIHVLLDNPWKGQEIAVVNVPAEAQRHAMMYQVAVPAVEGLTGKHAIYLVAEGADIQPKQDNRPQWGRRQQQRPEGLFDLHGIGFSKNGKSCEAPEVPQITIMADGKELTIPALPIRTTNQNGYTDLTRYQVYAPQNISRLEVKSSVPGVKTSVSPITKGRATVTCEYNGKEKIFLIN
jgi:hypothetical protein